MRVAMNQGWADQREDDEDGGGKVALARPSVATSGDQSVRNPEAYPTR